MNTKCEDNDKEQSGKARLRLFLRYKKITKTDFVKEFNLSEAYFTKMDTGFSQKALINLHLKFPELNIMWLLFGEGNMIITENNLSNGIINETEEQKQIKLIEQQQETISKLTETSEVFSNHMKTEGERQLNLIKQQQETISKLTASIQMMLEKFP